MLNKPCEFRIERADDLICISRSTASQSSLALSPLATVALAYSPPDCLQEGSINTLKLNVLTSYHAETCAHAYDYVFISSKVVYSSQ